MSAVGYPGTSPRRWGLPTPADPDAARLPILWPRPTPSRFHGISGIFAVPHVYRRHTVNPRAAEVVNLCFFAGLTQEQAAQSMGISVATVERTWAFARAWLFQEIRKDAGRTP